MTRFPVTVRGRSQGTRQRAGNGPGRVYTITVESRDYSGNSSVVTVTVTVPHDM
jgi:hypothetical protein